MPTSLILGAFVAACTGPYCGPDSDYEFPGAGLLSGASAPAIAVAEDGSCYVAWEWEGSGARDILFNRRAPGPSGAWGTPVRLDRDPAGSARSLEVRLVAGAEETVFAAWQDARLGRDEIFFARSLDGGRHWSEETIVSSGEPGVFTSSMPALAADGAGRVYLAWEDLRSGERDVFLAVSSDFGSTWAEERRFDSDAPGSAPSYHPQIAAWEDGEALVVWWDERNGLADLYARRTTDGALTWTGVESRVDPGPAGAVASRGARVSAVADQVAIAWEELTSRTSLEKTAGLLGGSVVGRVSQDRGRTWGEVREYGRGQDPVVAAWDPEPACGWLVTSAPSQEKTSIGGRIMPLPTLERLKCAPANRSGASAMVSQIHGPSSAAMVADRERVWVVRTGSYAGRAIVESFVLRPESGSWARAILLQFGGQGPLGYVPTEARSVAAALAADGSVHLVWVTDADGSGEVGYFRVQPLP